MPERKRASTFDVLPWPEEEFFMQCRFQKNYKKFTLKQRHIETDVDIEPVTACSSWSGCKKCSGGRRKVASQLSFPLPCNLPNKQNCWIIHWPSKVFSTLHCYICRVCKVSDFGLTRWVKKFQSITLNVLFFLQKIWMVASKFLLRDVYIDETYWKRTEGKCKSSFPFSTTKSEKSAIGLSNFLPPDF